MEDNSPLAEEKKTCGNCNYFLSSDRGKVCNALYPIADVPIAALKETSYCNEQHWEPKEERRVIPELTHQIVVYDEQNGSTRAIASNIELPDEPERSAHRQPRNEKNWKGWRKGLWFSLPLILAIALISLILLP